MLTNMRKIKSFVHRQGRITTGQQNAIDSMNSTHIIQYTNAIINLDTEFNRESPKIIEIGFGMGHSTWQIAKNNPDNDYLGIEVHSPGVGSLLMLSRDNNVNNIKVIQHDAVEVLEHMISNNSIAGFHIFFPDPWHKKRHHKRRLIQTEFIQLLCSKLKPNGYIHIATDWEDYANWIRNILQNYSFLKDFPLPDNIRPITKFEKRGIGLGHKIEDFYFIKL
jgi:tRNA (guanine-N7-)-methyltransferase